LALTLSPSSSLSFAAGGQRSLNAIGVTSGRRAPKSTTIRGLPSSATSTRSTEAPVNLTRANARSTLSIAIAAGTGIASALRDLRSGVELAEHGSLVSPNTNLTNAAGTRISVVNIDAQMKILLGRINSLVSKSSQGTVNFISSNSRPIRIQSTTFGGNIDVQPLALDTAGLGLDGLSLLKPGGIKDALAHIETAILYADQRLSELQTLQQITEGASVFSQELTRALGGFGSSIPARGNLVDLIG